MRLFADKIASATKNVALDKEIRVSKEVIAKEGYIVAARIHGNKTVYNELEDTSGRNVTLHDGDLIVGVLGHRNALHQYSGFVPEAVNAGDKLHVLNMGGVIGQCTSSNPKVGTPFEAEILGSVQVFPEFGNRQGVPAHIGMNTLENNTTNLSKDIPIVFVVGTCMNSGKTLAACSIIRGLTSHKLKVAACKLTGVSRLGDTLEMQDYGASWAYSFNDVGIVTTSPKVSVETAKKIISSLKEKKPDVIICELGDGILGKYGVKEILADPELMNLKSALVLCASDPVGVWGGVNLLKNSFELEVDVVSGPVTDNTAGTGYIEEQLKIAAHNAQTDKQGLTDFIYGKIK